MGWAIAIVLVVVAILLGARRRQPGRRAVRDELWMLGAAAAFVETRHHLDADGGLIAAADTDDAAGGLCTASPADDFIPGDGDFGGGGASGDWSDAGGGGDGDGGD